MPDAMLARLAGLLRDWGIGARPGEWRLPPIETYPRVVAFAQTIPGRVLLIVAFAALLRPITHSWLELTAAAAIVSAAGRYRYHAIIICTILLLARGPTFLQLGFSAFMASAGQQSLRLPVSVVYFQVGGMLVFAALVATVLLLVRRHRDHPLARRPVLALHVVACGLIVVATSGLLSGLPLVLLWSLTGNLLGYFWFLSYALADQRGRKPAPLAAQAAGFSPFFSFIGLGTSVPFAKGGSGWINVEAQDPRALAVTQLKAVKLLVWAWVLKVLLWTFRRVVYGKLGVVPMTAAFDRFLVDPTAPIPHGLLSIVANFPEQLLSIAIWGHLVVALARLAGFRLLRNTWRPLSARSIAEFWNRYFYYFKEILVHFYFYPTYLRWFRNHPRLRIAFATVMAAGVGNFFCHLILDSQRLAGLGLLAALERMQTYGFYCVMLAGGIALSQLTSQRRPPADSWWRGQLLPAVGVMTFFCFLSFFDGPQRHVALAQHFAFLFNVFGVDRWMPTNG